MRRGPLALSAASILLLSLTAVSCDDGGDGIDVARVGRADVVEVVDAPATVVATAAATLTAVADGTLATLRVRPGAEVTEGQLLAVIDSPGAQRRLDQAAEALALADQAATVPAGGGAGELAATQDATDAAAGRAFDQARQAAEQLADERLREALQAQVAAAREQYQAAAAAARAAVRAVQQGVASLGSAVSALGAAQRLQAEQAYELAEATVDQLTLRAPFDGTVQLGGTGAPTGSGGLLGDLLGGAGAAGPDGAAAGGLPGGGVPGVPGGSGPPPGVDPVPAAGAPVSAGTPVLTVVDVTELGAVAQVDETDILLVEPGVTAELELDAAPGARYPATVTAVDLLPTPSARGGVAYRVRLTVQAGSAADGTAAPPPRPGMSAVAALRVGEAVGAVAVPAAAVLRLGDADVVWAVRDGRAVRTPVTVGVQGRDVVEIASGLQPGDRIVVRGADRVTEGQRLP